MRTVLNKTTNRTKEIILNTNKVFKRMIEKLTSAKTIKIVAYTGWVCSLVALLKNSKNGKPIDEKKQYKLTIVMFLFYLLQLYAGVKEYKTVDDDIDYDEEN